jgi:hypothetical protein
MTWREMRVVAIKGVKVSGKLKKIEQAIATPEKWGSNICLKTLFSLPVWCGECFVLGSPGDLLVPSTTWYVG